MPEHAIELNAIVTEPSAATLACLEAVNPGPWGVTTNGQMVVALLNRIAVLELALAQVEDCGDPVVEENVEFLRSRSRVVQAKYGTLLTRGDLTAEQWIDHVREELGDALNYATRLKTELAEPAQPPAQPPAPRRSHRPEIVCLCGSTRFGEAFDRANYALTLGGTIVLSIGCVTHSDSDLGINPEQKAALDELHKRKIDMADRVLVLNVGGYIGESTRGEIEYAHDHGKPIEYLEPIEAVHAHDLMKSSLAELEGDDDA